MTRKSSCIAIAIGALLLAPSAASAGSVRAEADGVVVSAGFGSTVPHTINVSFSGGTYLVTDSVAIDASAGCVQGTATSVTCTDPGATGVGVTGGAAGDTLIVNSVAPGVGKVQVLGSNGSDTIIAREDTLANPGAPDLLKGEDGDDFIDGGFGPDSITGGMGTDTATYASRSASQPVSVSIESGPAKIIPDGGQGEDDFVETENVIGGAGNDSISGLNQQPLEDAGPANVFTGGGGNDRLSGGPGADRLDGEGGKDTLSGGAQKDNLNGGAGKDRCIGGPSKDSAKKCERKASI